VLRRNLAPEVTGNVSISLVACQFISPRGSDDLWNICVGMKFVEDISVFRQRVEKFLVVEPPRQPPILFLSCDRVQVEQRLVHSAVLDHLHVCPLRVTDRFKVFVHPTGHVLRRSQRLFVAAERVHVQMPGQNLVIGVERRPDPGFPFP
jgi:hypothetical protein